MNTPLRQEFEQYIAEQVEQGHFHSPSEVIEAALARLMSDQQDLLDEQDRTEISTSCRQMADGQVHDFANVAAAIRLKYLKK